MEKPQDTAREAWMLLFQLFRSQRREMMTLHSDFQLNPAQVHLLLNLEPEVGVPMSELAEALACDASYITSLVDKVEDRGLVQRLPSPADRRVKLISLTPEGVDTRERLLERCSQPPPFIAALSDTDKTALRDIFLRATQAAQKSVDGQAGP
jgi:MarR family transcriptional regulator, organic hydroperoxide resistance regulator